MKRVKICAVLLVLVLILSACSSYISKSDAMDAAMKDLGLIQINVSNLTAELDKSTSPVSYKVTFVYISQNYTYVIDAESGTVIKKDISK